MLTCFSINRINQIREISIRSTNANIEEKVMRYMILNMKPMMKLFFSTTIAVLLSLESRGHMWPISGQWHELCHKMEYGEGVLSLRLRRPNIGFWQIADLNCNASLLDIDYIQTTLQTQVCTMPVCSIFSKYLLKQVIWCNVNQHSFGGKENSVCLLLKYGLETQSRLKFKGITVVVNEI